MQLICPACRTPLPGSPAGRAAVLTCERCSAEVDVSRAGTAAGRPRFVPELDRSGDTVSGFVLEERIGAGGMGTVYRARRPGDAGPVAVKFLSPALASEPDVVARFQREVKLLLSLSHPSIVRVIDHGDENGIPWFAMELVDGLDLRGRLARGPLGLQEATQVFGRLFEALGHAHAKGIIHRDLKPANVLIAPDGAKLADFGIARPDPDGASHLTKLTETAAVLGTFPYMSPEQRAGAEVDRRSDLFSAGVLLYEGLTGKLPQGAFAPPSRVNPALPARLDDVVSRLLQPDREGRYSTAEEAALAFHDAVRPRASMAPVIAFGAVAAITIALVVPAAMNMGGRVPVSKKQGVSPANTSLAAAVSPTPNPMFVNASNLDTDNAYSGDRFIKTGNENDVFPQQSLSGGQLGTNELTQKSTAKNTAKSAATPSPKELLLAEQEKKKQALTKGSKPIAADDDDEPLASVAQSASAATPAPVPSATPLLIASSTSGNRAETNYIKQIESQAALPEAAAEVVGMVATCGPTIVYGMPSTNSKIVGKLSKGHKIDKLKAYRQLAMLWDSVLGRGAGLFGVPEPRTKKSTKVSSAAEPQKQAAEPQVQQQTSAPPLERLWYLVRFSPKSEQGWVLGECATESKAEPAYRSDYTQQKSGSSLNTKRK